MRKYFIGLHTLLYLRIEALSKNRQPQHNRSAPLALQEPSDCAVCQTPWHSPLSKALQATCPVHDTQGAGEFSELSRDVMTEANNPIVMV